jgi:hypothetical protein
LDAPPLSAVGLLARLVGALFRRAPTKRLEATVLGRGIVAELPYDVPCRLIDPDGNEIRDGVYVLLIRLWNRGTLAVAAADFAPSAPLRIRLESSVRMLGAHTVSTVDSFQCEARLESANTIGVAHEGFNPGDDAIVSLFYTGPHLYAPVSVEGRIIGQSAVLDRTDKEGRASFGERTAAGVLLCWATLSAPALLICGYFIARDFGLAALWHKPATVPDMLAVPFVAGAILPAMAVLTWFQRWVERLKHPKGFPLDSDLEPPAWDSVKAMIRMIVTGRRYRISTSLFSVGEPVLMTRKPVRNRSIHDWIR